MQVMPPAGQDTAGASTSASISRRLAGDVAYNRRSALLRSATTSAIGAVPISWSSWSATPGRAAPGEWIDQYGDPRDPKVDPVDRSSCIPAAGGDALYVQRVLENMQVYRARFDIVFRGLSIDADMRRGS